MGRDRRHPSRPSRPRRWGQWLPTLLVLALIASAFAAHRFSWGPRYLGWYGDTPASSPTAIAPPAGLDLPAWSPPGPVATEPATVVPISAAAVAARLQRGLDGRSLGKHVVAAVGDLLGDGPVWASSTDQFVPASTTKLLTTTAALAVLGPDARFTTRVVQGTAPREVVLVGGGDPYLASKPLTPQERASTYPERADVVTLARAAARKIKGRRPVHVVFDDSLFTGPTNNPKWRADYVPDDIVSPITALWVDRGASPTGYGRSDDPSLTAAATFASALAKAGVRVRGTPTRGVAAPDAVELASVRSAPVSQIIEHVLDVSDNEAAEVLGHQVGLAVSGVGSFQAGAAGVLTTLASLGIDTGSDVVFDGSGLARSDRLSASTMLQVLQTVARPDQPHLRAVLTGLPVAGFTGSLADRFDSAGVAALGHVRAKTGTLSGVSALAGVIAGRDGTDMVFVLVADRTGQRSESDVEASLDALAADLASCRCGSG